MGVFRKIACNFGHVLVLALKYFPVTTLLLKKLPKNKSTSISKTEKNDTVIKPCSKY